MFIYENEADAVAFTIRTCEQGIAKATKVIDAHPRDSRKTEVIEAKAKRAAFIEVLDPLKDAHFRSREEPVGENAALLHPGTPTQYIECDECDAFIEVDAAGRWRMLADLRSKGWDVFTLDEGWEVRDWTLCPRCKLGTTLPPVALKVR